MESDDGRRTAWMVHPDGSWARADGCGRGQPTVHQGGPERLWDALERIRHQGEPAGGIGAAPSRRS